MEENPDKAIDLSSQKSVMEFLQNSSVKIAEVLTGILISEKNDWKLSAGKIVQATIKGSLLTQIGREIKKYQDSGKIKEDYFATHKSKATLYEFLKFLDEEVPDEELFTALKSIFFSGIEVSATQQDEALAYEFLQTAKKLSGTEVLILKANFEIAQGKVSSLMTIQTGTALRLRNAWGRMIARQMGYGDLYSVAMKYEANLESLGLIAPRNAVNQFQTEFEPTSYSRLTEMGYKFCEFVNRYPPVA